MRYEWLLYTLTACGGVNAGVTTEPLSAPVCTVAGVAYPACDGVSHTYGVRWMEANGNMVVCPALSTAARPGCASGDPCMVAVGGSLSFGACL